MCAGSISVRIVAVKTFDFTDGNSGHILKSLGYAAVTGWSACQIWQSAMTGWERRAFFNFDTSSIPDSAVVTKVEFKRVDAVVQLPPSGYPTSTNLLIADQLVDGSLDGNVGEFTGGNSMNLDIYADYSNGDWVDLSDGGQDPTGYVGKDGETDIIIRDTTGAGTTGWSFNTSRSKCQLRVTYYIPQAIKVATA